MKSNEGTAQQGVHPTLGILCRPPAPAPVTQTVSRHLWGESDDEREACDALFVGPGLECFQRGRGPVLVSRADRLVACLGGHCRMAGLVYGDGQYHPSFWPRPDGGASGAS